MSPDEIFVRRFPAFAAGLIVIAFLGHELGREFDPMAGQWSIAHAYVDGVEEPNYGFRLWLDISNGSARIANYWTCGVRCRTFAEGEMEVKSSEIRLYDVDPETLARAKTPNTRLARLPNGHLTFDSYTGEGKPLRLEFYRESNEASFFDLFNWH